MRTTIDLADDVKAAADRLRRERSMGLSEAINELARRGLTVKPKRKKWVQKTHSMGTAKVDLTNIGKALEELEGPWHR